MNDEKTIATKKEPPDGGYGWVIVFAMGLSTMIYIPLMHSFGLIFQETFIELDLSATEGALIINLNAALGNTLGLLNGFLLKIFGYRKIAYVGAFLLTSGVTITSFSRNFSDFVIFYGVIASLGIGLSKSAYSLALNTYFKKKRNRAMGITSTITGLGPVFIPQLINFLMKIHTAEGVTLIFGGICSHLFISATLLQPVKRFMKIDKEAQENQQELLDAEKNTKDDGDELVTIYGMDSGMNDSILTLNQAGGCSKRAQENEPKKSIFRRMFSTIAIAFDLDLLKDPVFINIVLGLAFAVFAEMNFTVLTPFILSEWGLSRDQVATFLSVNGVADIIFRFFAPYIGEYLKKSPRPMYLFTLFLLIGGRTCLLLTDNFYTLLAIGLGLGIAKGVRKVYMGVIIPGHVPLEKLPSASGMEMMTNGFCILFGGLGLGLVRDFTGSYTYCIIIMNCITFLTVIMWLAEAAIVKYKKRL